VDSFTGCCGYQGPRPMLHPGLGKGDPWKRSTAWRSFPQVYTKPQPLTVPGDVCRGAIAGKEVTGCAGMCVGVSASTSPRCHRFCRVESARRTPCFCCSLLGLRGTTGLRLRGMVAEGGFPERLQKRLLAAAEVAGGQFLAAVGVGTQKRFDCITAAPFPISPQMMKCPSNHLRQNGLEPITTGLNPITPFLEPSQAFVNLLQCCLNTESTPSQSVSDPSQPVSGHQCKASHLFSIVWKGFPASGLLGLLGRKISRTTKHGGLGMHEPCTASPGVPRGAGVAIWSTAVNAVTIFAHAAGGCRSRRVPLTAVKYRFVVVVVIKLRNPTECLAPTNETQPMTD